MLSFFYLEILSNSLIFTFPSFFYSSANLTESITLSPLSIAILSLLTPFLFELFKFEGLFSLSRPVFVLDPFSYFAPTCMDFAAFFSAKSFFFFSFSAANASGPLLTGDCMSMFAFRRLAHSSFISFSVSPYSNSLASSGLPCVASFDLPISP